MIDRYGFENPYHLVGKRFGLFQVAAAPGTGGTVAPTFPLPSASRPRALDLRDFLSAVQKELDRLPTGSEKTNFFQQATYLSREIQDLIDEFQTPPANSADDQSRMTRIGEVRGRVTTLQAEVGKLHPPPPRQEATGVALTVRGGVGSAFYNTERGSYSTDSLADQVAPTTTPYPMKATPSVSLNGGVDAKWNFQVSAGRFAPVVGVFFEETWRRWTSSHSSDVNQNLFGLGLRLAADLTDTFTVGYKRQLWNIQHLDSDGVSVEGVPSIEGGRKSIPLKLDDNPALTAQGFFATIWLEENVGLTFFFDQWHSGTVSANFPGTSVRLTDDYKAQLRSAGVPLDAVEIPTTIQTANSGTMVGAMLEARHDILGGK